MALTTRHLLYSIPYAGGTASAFRTLSDSLGQTVRYIPLELPGRGFRQGEPMCRTVDEMVDVLIRSMDREAAGSKAPYFLFGHSMGARLAYLIAVKMQAEGRPEPMHLFLGGEGPPEVSPWRSEATQMDRPERFRAEVIGSGIYPEDLLRIPDKAADILPIIRADLEAFDTYDPPRPPKLACDATAVIATRDVVKREEVERWARRTTGRFDVKTVTGGHFFFRKQMPALGKTLAESIRHHL